MNNAIQKLKGFVDAWVDTDEKNKEAFLRLKAYLTALPGVKMDFVPRPGVTYSLRAVHRGQKDRSLFAMVDVIEDDPRWLSVCFYNEMIGDPDQRGDFVPEGLLGEDALCFDLESYNEEDLSYIESRLHEACQSALKGSAPG